MYALLSVKISVLNFIKFYFLICRLFLLRFKNAVWMFIQQNLLANARFVDFAMKKYYAIKKLFLRIIIQ